jgi:hypothetical protein
MHGQQSTADTGALVPVWFKHRDTIQNPNSIIQEMTENIGKGCRARSEAEQACKQ